MDLSTWTPDHFLGGMSFQQEGMSVGVGPIFLVAGILGALYVIGKMGEPAESEQQAHKKYIDLVRSELSQTKDPARALYLKEILDQDRFGVGEKAAEERTRREEAAQRSTAFWVRQGSDGKSVEGPTWTDRGGK